MIHPDPSSRKYFLPQLMGILQWTALKGQIFEGLPQLQRARSHPCLPKVTPFPRGNSHLMTNAGTKRHGLFGPKGDKSQRCKTISDSEVLVVSSETYIMRGLLSLISPASSPSFFSSSAWQPTVVGFLLPSPPTLNILSSTVCLSPDIYLRMA